MLWAKPVGALRAPTKKKKSGRQRVAAPIGELRLVGQNYDHYIFGLTVAGS